MIYWVKKSVYLLRKYIVHDVIWFSKTEMFNIAIFKSHCFFIWTEKAMCYIMQTFDHLYVDFVSNCRESLSWQGPLLNGDQALKNTSQWLLCDQLMRSHHDMTKLLWATQTLHLIQITWLTFELLNKLEITTTKRLPNRLASINFPL